MSVCVCVLLCFYCSEQTSLSKAAWGRKGFCQITVYNSFSRKGRQESKVGTWRRESKQRLGKNTNCWFSLHGLLSLFSYLFPDHLPRGRTTRSGLDHPHQSLIKKVPLVDCRQESTLPSGSLTKVFFPIIIVFFRYL